MGIHAILLVTDKLCNYFNITQVPYISHVMGDLHYKRLSGTMITTEFMGHFTIS